MSPLPRFLLKFFFLAAMLLSLPLIGAWLAGFPIARYLEFPPQTRYVQHAPFSWSAFFVIALLIAAGVLAPVIIRMAVVPPAPPANRDLSPIPLSLVGLAGAGDRHDHLVSGLDPFWMVY